jgi:LacI family transcriptional regulator
MVTLKHLAKELNVSVSTVSKALSDSHEISKETKEKILALSKKLNYIPNNTAVNLRNRKTMTIGVVIPNIFNHYFTKILHGIESEGKKNGYKTIVSISNESLEGEKQSLDYFTNGSVDGILLAPSDETEKSLSINHILELKEKKIPFVFFDRFIEDLPCDKVVINDFESAKNLIKYFVQNGRKNIAVISSIKNLSTGKLRKAGVLSMKKEVHLLEFESEKGLEVKVEKLLKKEKIDALLCLDELSGVISLNIARKLNLNIPKDVAIICYNQGILSRYSYPRLSTINQHATQVGVESFKLLLQRLENPSEKEYQTVVLDTTLKHFQTT